MSIVCALEFVGQEHGWRATARLDDGRVITITQAQSPQAARRRLKRAVEAAGVEGPTFEEKLRIPAHLEAELSEYRLMDQQRTLLDRQVQEVRPRLAQRLLTELNLTEREVAAWLGVSHTHISTLLLAHTADTMPTGEYVRDLPPEQTVTLPKAAPKR